MSKWLFTVGTFSVELALLSWLQPEIFPAWIEFIFLGVVLLISFIDLYSKTIPNTLLLLLALVAVTQLIGHFEWEKPIAFLIVLVTIGGLNFLFQRYTSKQAFGWGDIKLMGVIGLFLGLQTFWVIYSAIILGGLLSMLGFIFKKISKSDRIPFAIFLLIGMLILRLDILKRLFYL